MNKYLTEDNTIYLFGRDDPAPLWWITFMEGEGLQAGSTISQIQVILQKYDAEFVCRKELTDFTDRYLKFKDNSAKTYFTIKFFY